MKNKNLKKNGKPTFTLKTLKKIGWSSIRKTVWLLFACRILALLIYTDNDFWQTPALIK